MNRAALLILLFGVGIRLVSINQPPVDAMTIRQCQTGDAIAAMHAQGGFPLDAKVSWRGDASPRLAQEFPLYHWLVLAPMKAGLPLQASAKCVSILLWAIAFLCLQPLWKRSLESFQPLIANLFFTLAPLSWFFSQAIMPESLMMALSIAFMLCAVRYVESPSFVRMLPCWVLGVLAMLVKPPVFTHLVLAAMVLMFWQQGWKKTLTRWELFPAAVLAGLGVLAWAAYCTHSSASFGNWSPASNLRGFLGDFSTRLQPRFYLKIGAYVTAFILTPLGVVLAGLGVWQIIRLHIWRVPGSRPLLLWSLSLLFFYAVWGVHGPGNHSYYNLPALVPASWLCAWGTACLFRSITNLQPALQKICYAAVLLALLIPAAGATAYLFKQDLILLEASSWVRENTQTNDLVLFAPNHRADMIEYPENPCFTYLSKRRGWIWTKYLKPADREAALQRAKYIVVTFPPPEGFGFWNGLARKLKQDQHENQDLGWLQNPDYQLLSQTATCRVYKNRSGLLIR